MNLTNLKNNEKGKIISLNLKGEIRRRFLDMGISKGVEFKVIRRAPLGDPIEISIKNYNLSLRKEEAENIVVEKK